MSRRRALRTLRAAPGEESSPILSVREVRKLLYRIGTGPFKDRVFLKWAEDSKASNAVQWRMLLAVADAWERPAFPLTGRDVMLARRARRPAGGAFFRDRGLVGGLRILIEDEFSLAERLKAVVQATAY